MYSELTFRNISGRNAQRPNDLLLLLRAVLPWAPIMLLRGENPELLIFNADAMCWH